MEKKIKRVGISSLGIREPSKKSLYDVLVENLKLAQRKTFIHRMIYAGVHNLPMESKENETASIQTFFQNIITEVNSDSFVFEILTGFLVYYKKHFIHIVEGDEDAINKHLQLLYKPENEEFFDHLKLFAQIHHINARSMNDWTYYYGCPRKMITPVEIITRADISMRITYCIKKVYVLFNILEREEGGSLSSVSYKELSVKSSLIPGNPPKVSLMSDISLVQQVARNKYSPYLPETEILEKLLNSEYPTDLKYFVDTYRTIVDTFIDEDRKWPIPLSPLPLVFSVTNELKNPTRLSQFISSNKSPEKDEDSSDVEENHE